MGKREVQDILCKLLLQYGYSRKNYTSHEIKFSLIAKLRKK